jgi:UDP-N-acetylglucosamine--N-acetylmuramyl-(pentapeptide) pyrophosphoryl-undecaprenol N-acetylglucosamine transferase
MIKSKIIIGSGGTGGHMFPAAAVANRFRDMGYEVVLITDNRGMRFGEDFKNDFIIELPVSNIRTGNVLHKIKGILQLLKSICISIKAIIHHKPVAIIGFGGYPSFPAAVAGILTNCPLFLHEQNAILGRTNKMLKFFATKIFLSFKDTKDIVENNKTIHTGNPVRQNFQMLADVPFPELGNKFRILVTGGSQGASIFSEVMPEICFKLPTDLRHKLVITHQARPEDIKNTQKKYKDYGINAQVIPFIENMAQEIASTHLVICRAGATTVAEISMIGRPALYVPLPTAADNQQTINAMVSFNLSAGRIIEQKDFTPTYVASIITHYYMHPDFLLKTAQNAKLLSKKNACHNIAKFIIDNV